MINLDYQERNAAPSGAGRAAASARACEGDHSEDDACILSDIFSNQYASNQLMEYIIVSAGVSRVRRDFEIKEDEPFLYEGGGGKKGAIVMFSKKSRLNLMIKLAEMKKPFEFWQDLTFADDIMTGLSITQRAKLSSKVMKAFKLWLDREGYKIQGVWKREWRPRISGILIGQYVPHYHLLYTIEGTSKEEYFNIARLFAEKWVRFTGTKEYSKAINVALHSRSYRPINSRKQVNHYISEKKYISKYGEFKSNESIGRNWGYIGKPEFGESEKIYLYQYEMVLLRRILRKLVKKKSKFRKIIAKKYKRFTLFIERSTINRILDWISQMQMDRVVKGVPF